MEKITPEEVMQMDINSLRNASRDSQAQVKLLNTLIETRQREVEDLRAQLETANETIRRNEGRRLFELCVQHGAQPGHVLDWLRGQLAQAAQTPEGFALVPVEPTPEMLAEIHLVESFTKQALIARYKAMLAAAPKGDSHE